MGVQIFHSVKKRFLRTNGTERNKSARNLLMYARAERRKQTVAEENMAIDVITELMSSHEYAERIIAKNDHKKLASKLKTT